MDVFVESINGPAKSLEARDKSYRRRKMVPLSAVAHSYVEPATTILNTT